MRSDTQGVAGKTAGSRTYAQMDTRGTIDDIPKFDFPVLTRIRGLFIGP